MVQEPETSYHVKAQPSLSLRIKHDEIHNADYNAGAILSEGPLYPFLDCFCEAHTRQHVSIPGQNVLITKARRFPRLVYHHAVRVHDPIGGHCGMCGRMLKGELGCELAVDGAREVDSALC